MIKQFTKLFCGLVLLIISGVTKAQTNIASYQFNKTTGTYTPITGGTTIFAGPWDSNVSGAIPLGGTFTFGGVPYTTCFVTSNGFLTFGAASTTTTYTPLSTTAATVLGVVSAYAQDGASSTATGSVPLISYTNVGNEFVLQYQNHTNYFNRADTMNFQIRLDLSSGVINIVYGASSNNGTSTSGGTPQVGLRGNTTNWADNVNNLMLANIPAGTTCTWADAVTGNSNSSSLVYTAGTNANIKIPNGLTYTWTPATTPAPVRTFSAVTNITTTSATITWAPAVGAAQYNVQYRVPGTCGWTNFGGSPVSDTSVSLTGLTVGTTYQVRVQSVSGAGNSIWSHIPSSAAGSGTNGYTATGTFTTTVLCPVPTSVTVGTITATSATVTFTSTGSNFILEYGATGFTPGTDASAGAGGTIVTGTSSPIILAGLTAATTYQVYVRQNCTAGANGYSTNSAVVSFTTPALPPANDNASGAITLTVGAGCTGAIYTNAGATFNTGEPYPSCSGVAQTPVWFKFVAPASGAVRVSTDLGTAPTLTDTKVGLFSATDPANYSTFSIISCDDDGGSAIGSGFLSVVYATGLTAGTTYYVAVDKYTNTTTNGTFCIAVDELSNNMLSLTNTCTRPYQTPINNSNTTYTGWSPLLDSSSLLIALVRNPAGGSVGAYTVSQNVNTGTARQANGTYYLNRNYRISNSTATNVDVQFFFLNAELAALAAVDPAVTLANLGVTRQNNGTSTTCYNDVNLSGGALSFIPQTGNGTAGGTSWISFTTPAFSNFYLNRAGTVLPISLTYLKGLKAGTGNSLNWKVNCTSVSITMELERSSDSRNFKSITSITASQARCGQPFDYVDAAPLKSTNYYRLKMIDVDGKVTYSPIVAIINGASGAELVGIYPTVVRDEALLSVAASRNTKMQINITDMSGRIIKTISQTVANGSTLVSIHTAALSSGVYNITGMLDGVQTKTLRFVKQ